MTLIAPSAVRGVNSDVKVMRPNDRKSLSRSATRALDVLELFGVTIRCGQSKLASDLV